MVGDSEGRAIQYDLNEGKSMLKVQRDYGNLGIGSLRASAQFEKLVILGGHRFCFKVIDVCKRSVVRESFFTNIRIIYSFCFCPVSSETVFLSVAGLDSEYLDSQMELFDVTNLVQNSRKTNKIERKGD